MGSEHDNFIGGIFDFNRDGKTDLNELITGNLILQQAMKQDNGGRNNSSVSRPIHTPIASKKRPTAKKKRKWKWIICTVFFVLLALAACYVLHTASVYDEAVRLIASGKYEQAASVLVKIEDRDYKDTDALILICRAHMAYNDGNLEEAYHAVKLANLSYEADALSSEIADFKNTVINKYDSYLFAQEQQAKREYEERIKNGVPFVGMPESKISSTSLGAPSEKVRHNRERKDGQQYTANLYDFYQNRERIFTARCVQGEVIEVWDWRKGNTSSYVPKGNSSGSSMLDPSVDGFRNPEDFYDYYWDDFFDYEDAEAYYYEHGGE